MRPNYENLGNPIRYMVMYCLYAALTGLTFFTLTFVYDLGSIVQAFASTCALFVGLSVVGFTTKLYIEDIHRYEHHLHFVFLQRRCNYET